MTEDEKQAIRLEVAALNIRYADAADSADGAAFSACFTEDGVYDRMGTEFVGRAAVAAVQQLHSQLKRRHFISNAIVEFGNDGQVTGRGYLMVIFFDPETREQKPPICVDFKDVYRKTSTGWLIGRRSASRAF